MPRIVRVQRVAVRVEALHRSTRRAPVEHGPTASGPSPPPEPVRRRRFLLPVIFIAGSLAGAVAAGFGPEALTRLAGPQRSPPEVAAAPAPAATAADIAQSVPAAAVA